MPKQVKKFTPRCKQMCGCEICIHCKQLQYTLNTWRKIHAYNKYRSKYDVFSDDNVLHLSPRDVINGMMCPEQSGSSLPKLKCVLQQCASCPKNIVPEYESIYISVSPRIKCHQYVLFSTYYICGLLGESRLRCNLCDTGEFDSKIRSRNIYSKGIYY